MAGTPSSSSTGSLPRRSDVYPLIEPERFAGAFVGKVCLVTGAGRGIGRAVALAFARSGASVAFVARTLAEIEDAKAQATSEFGGKHVAVSADAASPAEIGTAVEMIRSTLGPIDVVCCAAGTNYFQPLALSNSDEYWNVIQTNLRGPIDITGLVLPGMIERGAGTIIYISSVAGCFSLPFASHYTMAKGALIRLAGCVNAELNVDGPSPISVFAMHPGEIASAMHDQAFRPENLQAVPQLRKLREVLTAKSQGNSVNLPAWTSVFLASGAAHGLSGRYIDCTTDLGEVLQRLDKVLEQDLYALKVEFL